MERQGTPERPTGITLYLKPQDLEPGEERIARWQALLTERGDDSAYFALGALISTVTGVAEGIHDGDGRQVARSVRIGLALITAYEVVTEERRNANNVDNSTLPAGSDQAYNQG